MPPTTPPSMPSRVPPYSFIEHFRWWYEHEKDANAKSIAMLESVPEPARTQPGFARAMGKMGHLVVARQMWLYRLGHAAYKPQEWFPVWSFDELRANVSAIQDSWTTYLATLTEPELAREFEYTGADGVRRRWPLLDLLTQVGGHAWYHRGQIAMLVKDLGGAAVDTDYIFWNRPVVLSPAS